MSRLVGLMWVDQRLLRRDPVALFMTAMLPLAIAAVLGSIHVSERDASARLAVVVEGQGPVAALLQENLEKNPVVATDLYPNRPSAERAVRRRDVNAAVVIPAAIDAPDPDGVEVVLVGPPSVAAPAGVRAAVENAAAETGAVLVVGRELHPGDPLGSGLEQAEGRAAAAFEPVTSRFSQDPQTRRGAYAASGVAGVIVLFTFMNTMAKSAQLAKYGELGVLARLRTTDASTGQVMAGFVLSLTAYAVAQALLIFGATAVLMDVAWRQPLLVIAILTVVGLAAGCAGALIGCLLPSSAARATVAGPVGFVMGMVGGTLWPLDIVGPTMQTIGRMVPHAWAVDALNAVVFGHPTGDWLLAVGVLLAFSLAFVLVTLIPLHRRIERAI